MSSKAKLPSEEVWSELEDLTDQVGDIAARLRELEDNEAWTIWNLGGAAFGKPEFRGPGHYTAEEFTKLARHLHGRLEAVSESFTHRQLKEDERAAQRV